MKWEDAAREMWVHRRGEWQLHVRRTTREELDRLFGQGGTEQEPLKRPRGNQDYSTLHLGRGTKWLK